MRDRIKVARAALRSEIYRGARRSSGAAPLGARAVLPLPGAGDSSGNAGPRRDSAAPSHLAALGLLGLLDLLEGG